MQSASLFIESDDALQPVAELILSEPSSTDITVQVIADDITATGE